MCKSRRDSGADTRAVEDGRVRILSLPGHTPGHRALLIDLVEDDPVVLSGDVCHFRLGRAERNVRAFNVDVKATLASMLRLERLLRETRAALPIEHDLERCVSSSPAAGCHR